MAKNLRSWVSGLFKGQEARKPAATAVEHLRKTFVPLGAATAEAGVQLGKQALAAGAAVGQGLGKAAAAKGSQLGAAAAWHGAALGAAAKEKVASAAADAWAAANPAAKAQRLYRRARNTALLLVFGGIFVYAAGSAVPRLVLEQAIKAASNSGSSENSGNNKEQCSQ